LGIPTVIDRFIQQALLQILQQDWEEINKTPILRKATQQ
jgi:retron-type reverse transcriptase